MSNEITARITALTEQIEVTEADCSLLPTLLKRRAKLYTSVNEYRNAFDDYIKAAELKDDGSLFLIEDDDYGWCMTSAFCIALLRKNVNFLDYLFYSEYNDNQTSRNEVREYLTKTYTTQEDWNVLFSNTKDAFQYMPEQFLTESMCLTALNRDDKVNTDWGSLLQYIPAGKITREMCEIAVRHSGWALKYIPDAFKTPELCLLSVRREGIVLEYVPEDSKSAEICLAAVQNDGFALQYVPDRVKTKDLCDAAMNGDAQMSYLAFADIPDRFKTPEMCLEAVTKWGYALQHVPREYKTKEMCLIAVQKQSFALDYVPRELLTPEICMTAIKDKGLLLEYVPPEMITLEMCVTACKASKWCLEYVPEHLVGEVETICGIKRQARKQEQNTDMDTGDDIPF